VTTEQSAPTHDTRFDVLHALRIKGFASPEAVAGLTRMPSASVEKVLVQLEADELVGFRDGRVSGWRLTATGTAAHRELLEQHAQGTSAPALAALHHVFVPLNTRLKELCTAWQLRDGAINDHADQEYDRAVVADAAALQVDVDRMLGDADTIFTRTPWYRARLQSANARFAAGDASALARPLSDSYHDVWMELHQDLILTLGLTRTEADA
jgi:hypothetical protein